MLRIENYNFKAIVILASIGSISTLDFPPSGLKKCHANDEKCWIEQSHKFLEIYGKGIPEENIKSLEPFEVDDFVMKGDGNTPTTFNIAFKDMKIYNTTKTRILSIKGFSSDTTKPVKLHVSINMKTLTYISKYKIDGKILIFPIIGEGDAVMHVKNARAKLIIDFKTEKRDDGKTYLQAIDMKMTTRPEDVIIHLSNLFNGDKDLSENVLKVLNENWRLFDGDFYPPVHKSFGKLVIAILNNLLKDVPYEDFFLKD